MTVTSNNFNPGANARELPKASHYRQVPQAAPTPPPQASPVSMLTEALPDVLKQLDGAATTHISISGVLVAFYAGSIFSGKVIATATLNAIIYAFPLLLLLATIILAVRVFHPAGYVSSDYTDLLRAKQQRLRLSSLLLEISIALVALAIFVYLLRPAA